jgi:hypothetical protein
MRSTRIILALLAAAATPVLFFPKHGVGWMSGEELLADILFWPVFIVSIILMFISAASGAFKRPFGSETAAFAVAAILPFTLVGTITIRSIGKRLYLAEQHRRELWFHYDDVLVPHIIKYVQQHPSSVSFPFNDDRASITGLGAFLRQRVSDVPIVQDDIIDPWGNAIWIVMDHDNDMQLKFENEFYGVWNPTGNKLVVALHTKKQYSLEKAYNEQWQLDGGRIPK